MTWTYVGLGVLVLVTAVVSIVWHVWRERETAKADQARRVQAGRLAQGQLQRQARARLRPHGPHEQERR